MGPLILLKRQMNSKSMTVKVNIFEKIKLPYDTNIERKYIKKKK